MGSVPTQYTPRFEYFIMRHSPAFPLRTGFENRPVHAKFVVSKATLGHSGVSIIFSGGGGSTNSVEDRGQTERGAGGGSPLVRGSGDSCNLVQEISFHSVKFS